MIAATVTLTTAGQSLATLIAAATSAQKLPTNHRVCWVSIQWNSGTIFHMVYKSGTVTLTTDSGFEFEDTEGKRVLVIAPGIGTNVLSLDEIYLAGGAGNETARVTAFVI